MLLVVVMGVMAIVLVVAIQTKLMWFTKAVLL